MMSNHRFGPAAILGLSLALPACGADPAKLARQLVQDPEPRTVVLATPEQRAQNEVVPDSYIVTFRAPKGSSLRRFASFRSEYGHHYAYLADQYLADPRIKDLDYITTVNLANPKNPAARAELAPPPALRLAWTRDDVDEVPGAITRVDFADHASAASALKEWEDNGDIWFAEPNYLNHLMDGTGSPYTAQLAQTYQSMNVWWHTMIKLPQALAKLSNSTLGTVAVPVVAILDSGVDIQNPGLSGKIWQNPSPGQSGCPGDVNGCDVTVAKKGVLGSPNVWPYSTEGYGQTCPEKEAGVCEHGTHVSGIVAANPTPDPGGAGGIGGVCPVCQVLPIKIIAKIGGSGSASDAAILAAFKYLTLFKNTSNNQGLVRVANSSFGKYVRARAVGLLVSVLKSPPNEVLVVGAAGNEDSMLRSYPAAFSEAIGVSAVGPDKSKALYSNFGPWVTVAAPGGAPTGINGDEIESTVPGSATTGYLVGTSMACPVVAGVAGLVLSVDPGRSFDSLRASIVNTADPSLYDPSINGGNNYNFYYPKIASEAQRRPLLGTGIVDAVAALDGTAHTGYAANATVRVDSSCGALGGGAEDRSGDVWLLLGLLVLPLAAAAQQSLTRRR